MQTFSRFSTACDHQSYLRPGRRRVLQLFAHTPCGALGLFHTFAFACGDVQHAKQLNAYFALSLPRLGCRLIVNFGPGTTFASLANDQKDNKRP